MRDDGTVTSFLVPFVIPDEFSPEDDDGSHFSVQRPVGGRYDELI